MQKKRGNDYESISVNKAEQGRRFVALAAVAHTGASALSVVPVWSVVDGIDSEYKENHIKVG